MTRLLHAAVVAVGLAGCSDPYDARSTTPTPAATTRIAPGGELPGRIPESARPELAQPQTRPAPSAYVALRRYAALTTDWTAANAASRYRAAAKAATGQARRDAQQTAASILSDPQLVGTSSRATAVAVVPQADGWALVITREQLAPDAGPARYRVYRGHTRPVAGGVAVDAWEPQP